MRPFLRSLNVHIAVGGYDIVHAMLPAPCNVYHPHAGIEAVGWHEASVFRKLTNRRTRMYVQTERAMFRQIRGAGSTNTPVMLCLSDHARAEAALIYPSAAHRMATLYSGVDDARFIPDAPATPPTTSCLFIGQDFDRKGLDTAIRAIAASSGACLRVIGRDDPAKYIALAETLGVSSRVTFAGPSSDVAKELADTGVLLLPARREPFGMVVPEAMLMGRAADRVFERRRERNRA